MLHVATKTQGSQIFFKKLFSKGLSQKEKKKKSQTGDSKA